MMRVIYSMVRTRQAFTLIETIVAMGIFVTLATIVVVNFRLGAREEDLRIAADELVSFVRKAQTFSLAGETVQMCFDSLGKKNSGTFCSIGTGCVSPNTCLPGVPPGGYGIDIQFATVPPKRSYILFADEGDGTYTSLDFASETIQLPNDVLITKADVDGSGYKTIKSIDISFQPPDALSRFAVGGGTAITLKTLKILLQQSALQSCREVEIGGITGKVEQRTIGCS